jgi:hypothetical protein
VNSIRNRAKEENENKNDRAKRAQGSTIIAEKNKDEKALLKPNECVDLMS